MMVSVIALPSPNMETLRDCCTRHYEKYMPWKFCDGAGEAEDMEINR